jgi:hypothetical protein
MKSLDESVPCGDVCRLVNARRREEWNIPDRKEMTAENYRRVRDLIL